MKKAQLFSSEKLVSILLTLIFLAIIFVIVDSFWNPLSAKTVTMFSDDKTYEESGQKNKTIQQLTSFNDKVKACQDSKNNDCFCNVNLKFPADHELIFNSNEGKLIRKQNLVATIKISLNKILNNNLNCEVQAVNIKFDEKRIVKSWAYDLTFFAEKSDLFKNSRGEICWVTNKVDANLLKNKNNCQ